MKKELFTNLSISKKEFECLNETLKKGSSLEIAGVPPKTDLFSAFVTFKNGAVGYLTVYTGDESVMSTYQVSDDKDSKYIECDEGMDTTYELELNEVTYTLTIEITD